MLSEQTKRRLKWIDGGRQPQSPEQVLSLFREAGLPCHLPVAQAFAIFGGGRFCIVESIDSRHVQIDRFKTKYSVLYAREVVREMKPVMKRHPHQFFGFDDPIRFRVRFAEANRCHERFTLDGFGHVYEADDRRAPSLQMWLESFV